MAVPILRTQLFPSDSAGLEGEAGEPFGGYEDEGTWRKVEGGDIVNAVIRTTETKKNSSSPFSSSSSS